MSQGTIIFIVILFALVVSLALIQTSGPQIRIAPFSPFLLFIIVASLVVYFIKKQLKAIEHFAGELGGRLEGQALGYSKIKCFYDGKECAIVVKGVGGRGACFLEYSCPIKSNLSLIVEKEGLRGNIFSPLMKLAGLKDIKTGDPVFDKKYYVRGENESQAAAALTNANNRKEVEELLCDSSRLTIKAGTVKLTSEGTRDLARLLSAEKAKEKLRHLTKLAGSIEGK